MKKFLFPLFALCLLLSSCSKEDDLNDYASLITKYDWHPNYSINTTLTLYNNHLWVLNIGSSSHLSTGALTDGSYMSAGRWEIKDATLSLRFLVSTASDESYCPYIQPTYSLTEYDKEKKAFMDGSSIILKSTNKTYDCSTTDVYDKSVVGTYTSSNYYKNESTGEVVSLRMTLDSKGNATFQMIDNNNSIVNENTTTYSTSEGIITFTNFLDLGSKSYIFVRTQDRLQFYSSKEFMSKVFTWIK